MHTRQGRGAVGLIFGCHGCTAAPYVEQTEYLLLGRPRALMARQADPERLRKFYLSTFERSQHVMTVKTLAESHDWTARPSPLQQGAVPFVPEGVLDDALYHVNSESPKLSSDELHERLLQQLAGPLGEKELLINLKPVRPPLEPVSRS